MRIIRYILPLLMLAVIGQAAPVTQSTATTAAINWFAHRSPAAIDPSEIAINQVLTFTTGETVDCYLFLIEPVGFVIVSGDDATIPVIGYSYDSAVEEEIDHPAVAGFFETVQLQLQTVRADNIDNRTTQPLWQEILDNNLPPFEQDRDVSPLLSCNWDQGCGWNADCPVDNGGPCNHVWAGCVATAMGMVMKYWSHPAQGEGAHGYTHPDYGYQYANFGATTYNWAGMPNNSANSYTAELLYHVGVSVDMDYAPDGSGAYTSDGVYALEQYFDYNSAASFANKNYYSNSTWEGMMRSQLDNGRPMPYRGYGSGGHAFVLDGYQGSNYFHFNWGWSGSYNGYFYLNDLTPGSYTFTSDQGAIINLYPNTSNTAPVVTDIPNQLYVPEGTQFATINLDDYVSDAETPDAQISWTYSGNVELGVSIVNRVATVTAPDEDWFGVETITFRATDPGGLWDEDPATFWMEAANDPPVVSDIPNQYLMEGAVFATIDLDAYVIDDETPDEYIIWSWYGQVELQVSVDSGIATITTPDPDWYGLETITFVATDWGALYDEDAATFWMQNVNDPPQVADIPDQEITAGAEFTQINLDDYVFDVDHPDNQLVWLTAGETDLNVDIDTDSRIATITYTPGWSGSETVSFTAWDGGGLNDSDEATYTVVGGVPGPVEDLLVTIDGDDLLLEWSAVSGAVEYNIYRLEEPYDPSGVLAGTTVGTSYTIAGELLSYTEGFYTVRVVY
ncbi:MAG: C10 family peptidase [Candidatus Delongbacteria bacterium]|nr:C10 family peptidase [Candidatus Delongbacteria bacterium]